jgi:hypothetical protein
MITVHRRIDFDVVIMKELRFIGLLPKYEVSNNNCFFSKFGVDGPPRVSSVLGEGASRLIAVTDTSSQIIPMYTYASD